MAPNKVLVPLALVWIGGCAFVPLHNERLVEARTHYANAIADPLVAELAAPELRDAAEFIERAARARDTLNDPAVIDHIAYMAKQKVAIARELAEQRRPGAPQVESGL
jgi:hypothetical protein